MKRSSANVMRTGWQRQSWLIGAKEGSVIYREERNDHYDSPHTSRLQKEMIWVMTPMTGSRLAFTKPDESTRRRFHYVDHGDRAWKLRYRSMIIHLLPDLAVAIGVHPRDHLELLASFAVQSLVQELNPRGRVRLVLRNRIQARLIRPKHNPFHLSKLPGH
jgi:hypothetical protein